MHKQQNERHKSTVSLPAASAHIFSLPTPSLLSVFDVVELLKN